MSKIRETIGVACPMHYIMNHAQRFFTVHRRDVTPGTIALRVDLSALNLPGAAQARHDVHVEHELRREPGKPGEIAVSWDPADRTVPSFAGTLHCSEGGEGETILALDGEYEPPLGVAGAVFDLVVGRRIAAATLQALLEDIKRFVEADFKTALSTNLADSPKE